MPLPRWLDVDASKQRWIEAQFFKRRVRRLLAPEKVSFVQWLVLEALSEFEHPLLGGGRQVQVADRLGISERVVSYTVSALVRRGAIERGDGEELIGWGIALSADGQRLLRQCRQILNDAVKEFRLGMAA